MSVDDRERSHDARPHYSHPHNPTGVVDQVFRSSRRRKIFVLAAVAFVVSFTLVVREFGGQNFNTVREDVLDHPPSIAEVQTVTATKTIAAPAVTETVTIQHNVVVEHEPVVFVLIMWSKDSATEGALLMKSILIHTSSPTEFHIICDESASALLESRLALVTRPFHNVHVRFYHPTWQAMEARVEREGTIKTDHSAGLPGLMKLFIHEILPPSVKKGIYIDTDAIFITDPTLLWNVFSSLKPTTAIAMSSHPDEVAAEWFHASRICSCVMLLDLEKLREQRLMDSSVYRADTSGKYPVAIAPPAFRSMYGEPDHDTGKLENVRLGDQGYWWAIVDFRPDLFEPILFDFEVTSCLMDTYLTRLGDETVTEEEELTRQSHIKGTPQEGKAVLPKLLHFNCLHGTPIYMEWEGWKDPENDLTKNWGPALNFHVGYKWIWLNQRNSKTTTTVDIRTVSNIIFADEAFAREHAIIVA